MLRRLGGCNRPDVLWSTDVPCETSVCGLDVKDVLTSWLRIPDRDEIRERTHQRPYGSARNLRPRILPGTSCCLLNLRSGEYWYYSYDSVSVDRFVP
jgi:hypothetical protein